MGRAAPLYCQLYAGIPIALGGDRVYYKAVPLVGVWQIASAYNGWLNTDQEKDGRRWPPGYKLGAIWIVYNHLLRQLVYLHTISSVAV